jgi:tetratricopeptide (TPR) repeat protein
MSIIHDALKKAERELETLPTGLPRYRGVRRARQKRRGSMAAGVLIGVTTMGAVSAWLWLQSLAGVPILRTTPPMPQSALANAQESDDQAEPQAVIAEPMPVTRPVEVPLRLKSDELTSSTAPGSFAFDGQTSAEAAFEKAREAESKSQWEQAVQYYRQALALNPTSVEARNNLGNLYIRQGQMTAAIGEFQVALALDPNYAIARNNLGSAYFLIGEEALAIQAFLAALRIDAAYVSPYYNLALLYARRGDVGQSVAFLTKALAIEPAVLSWLQEDPDFDGIREAPELQRVRAQGLARR